jgi:ssDNA-binding Zn-finger/Zn-ribbon topoisomerase 1
MGAKLSKQDVLDRFYDKHGDSYDYSSIEYAGTKTPVNIRCHQHDTVFSVTPENHFRRGDGCPICGRERQIVAATKPFSQFVREAREIHGNIYAYDEISYSGARKNMRIKCSSHSWFEQLPMVHLRGAGCSKCADRRTSEENKLTQPQYDEKLLAKYGGKISGVYRGMHDASPANCQDHGNFTSTPFKLLYQKHGCPDCAFLAKQSGRLLQNGEILDRLKELYGDKYDYSQVDYKGSKKKITLICPLHGEFAKIASNVLAGEACPKCAYQESSQQRTQGVRAAVERTRRERGHYFVDKATQIHRGFYDYSKVDFVNMRKSVSIICPIHGEFSQVPGTHLSGGCRKCADAELKGRYTETYFKRYPQETNRHATLYYVKIIALEETFYKVGITITKIKERFANLKGLGAELSVLATLSTTLRDAFDREQELLKGHAATCPFRPLLSESKRGSIIGATECFSSPLPNDLVEKHFPTKI